MEKIYFSLIISAILSLVLTPLARKFAIKFNFIDVPKDNRRVHTKAIPLLGGLAIFLAVIIAIFIFLDYKGERLGLLIGSTLILASGIIDDKYNLSPKAKMGFQILAAIILVVFGVRIEFFTNPFNMGQSLVFLEFLSVPITIFWIVGITNTINLIDGLDGLAA